MTKILERATEKSYTKEYLRKDPNGFEIPLSRKRTVFIKMVSIARTRRTPGQIKKETGIFSITFRYSITIKRIYPFGFGYFKKKMNGFKEILKNSDKNFFYIRNNNEMPGRASSSSTRLIWNKTFMNKLPSSG